MTAPRDARTPDMPDRAERVRTRLDELGLDALLVTTPSNRRWACRFTGSAGVLLLTAASLHRTLQDAGPPSANTFLAICYLQTS